VTATIKVVPLTEQHLDELLRYEREMFGPEAWSRASYRGEIADTATRRYLALEDETGALLGWGGVLLAADIAEITTVGIIPPARRRGLGRRLLRELCRVAADGGARELFLEVRVDNTAAIRLYETDGFETVGRRRGYYDHGRVDALTMRRELTS
jgi:ribosomal-protein-alanine acetyltransferase